MNSFHADGGYDVPHMVSLSGLESTSSNNGSHKPHQQLQMWDWEPAPTQTHHAADLHHPTPLFAAAAAAVNGYPYSLPSMGIGGGGGSGGYPFHSPTADVYTAALIKDEDDRGASQIGLNLGRRTYFPSGEAAAIEQLFRRSRGIYQASQPAARCQAEGCKADLSVAKHYHRRHKVCELHSKATAVVAGGMQQRFCQQCSRFHLLSEFDEAKRSCRKRLAEHNRRRRKSLSSPTMSTAVTTRSNSASDLGGSMDKGRHPLDDPTRNTGAKRLNPPTATSAASTIPGIGQNNSSLDDSKAAAHFWNGPSLSLGGGGGSGGVAAAPDKSHGFGFLSPYQSQIPPWVLVSDDNINNSGSQRSSSSSSTLFLQSPALFCHTPTEASHAASTAAEANLLQLGQGLLEVDFL